MTASPAWEGHRPGPEDEALGTALLAIRRRLHHDLLRAGVIGGGFADLGPAPDAGTARLHLPMLVSQLQRLRDIAGCPAPSWQRATTRRPGPSRSPTTSCPTRAASSGRSGVTPRPGQLVADLLAFARQGTAGWASVMALMRTLGYESGA